MTEQRKNVRFPIMASVNVEGLEEEETMLKDISITGCCVISPVNTQIEMNSKYKLEISPECGAKIDSFEIWGEAKWIRACARTFEIGFVILESPKGEQFLRYVDYLSWCYSQGNSITGESAVRIPAVG